MQELIKLISQADRKPSSLADELTAVSRTLSQQVQSLREQVQSIDHALEQENIPELNAHTSRLLNLQPNDNDKKEIVVALLTRNLNEFSDQIAKERVEMECIDRLSLLLKRKKEFEAERQLCHQIELLGEIDRNAYRYLCEKLKNEHLLARVASMVTKCRQTVESRLNGLVRKDSSSIVYSIAEICSVAHLIVNPEVINHILFCGYEKILQYSAVDNQVTVAKLTLERTDKHLTVSIKQKTFNPKQQLSGMLQELTESMSVLQAIERDIVPHLKDEQLLASTQRTKKSVLKDIAEEIAPVFYFMNEEEHVLASKLLEYDPIESSCPDITKQLMKLKHAIHKADQISHVTNTIISLLVTHNQSQQDLDRLFFFLESQLKLNKNEHSNLSLYLINALLEQLEDELQFSVVCRLLSLRQQLRKQIHERFGRN